MTLRRVFPGSEVVDEVDAAYEVPRRRWLRVNLITSIDGRVGGTDGTSATLTMGDDRTVLGAIRRASDIVLIGAETVRREGYLLPKSAALAIVTASGNLSGVALPADLAPGRVFVVCPSSVVELVTLPGAEIIGLAGHDRLRVHEIVDALHERGFDRIVCEGGPSLASQLLAAGLVDELCLSTSPLLVGTGQPIFSGTALGERQLTLTQLLVDDVGVSYARWTARR